MSLPTIQTNVPRETTEDSQKSPIVVNHEFLREKYEQTTRSPASRSRSESRDHSDFFSDATMNNGNMNNRRDKGKGKAGPLRMNLARDAPIFMTEPVASRLPKGVRRPPVHWFDPPDGLYREVWVPTIQLKIKNLIDENTKRMPPPRRLTMHLKFRGPSIERARPTVIITCQARPTAQFARRIIGEDLSTQNMLKQHGFAVKVGVDGTVQLADRDRGIYQMGEGQSLSQSRLPLDLESEAESEAPIDHIPVHIAEHPPDHGSDIGSGTDRGFEHGHGSELEIESLATMSQSNISPILSMSTMSGLMSPPIGISGSEGGSENGGVEIKKRSPTLLPADFPLPPSPPAQYAGAPSAYKESSSFEGKEEFKLQALADQRSYQNDLRGANLNITSSRFPDHDRKATIGGIVTVDGKPFGLTANHVFDTRTEKEQDESTFDQSDSGMSSKSDATTTRRAFEWLDEENDEFNERFVTVQRSSGYDTDDDLAFDSEGTYTYSSDEDSDEEKARTPVHKRTSSSYARIFGAFGSNTPKKAGSKPSRPAEKPPTPRSAPERGPMIPFIPNVAGDTESERAGAFFSSVAYSRSKYDWHLVQFEGALANAKLNVSLSNVGNVAFPVEGRHVTCETGGSGVLEGFISYATASRFYGGEWTELSVVRFSHEGPKPGDSGSWVLDSSNSDMYGHLISRSETLPLAYASPSVRVFDEIARKMNTSVETIQFPRVIQPKESAVMTRYRTSMEHDVDRRRVEELDGRRRGGAGEDPLQAQLRERRKREMEAEKRRLRKQAGDKKDCCIS